EAGADYGGTVENPRAAGPIAEKAEVARELADRAGEHPRTAGPSGADGLLVGAGPPARVDDRAASRSLFLFWLTHIPRLGVGTGSPRTGARRVPPRSLGARTAATPISDRGASGAVRPARPWGAAAVAGAARAARHASRPGSVLRRLSRGRRLPGAATGAGGRADARVRAPSRRR